MRLYPDIPSRRAATLARDAVMVLLVLLFAWLGLKVHDAVEELAVLGEGVTSAGDAVRNGFEEAAEAVDGVPLVGDEVADGLREAGETTGGDVARLGEEGQDEARDLARLLGVLTFALPAGLVLLIFLPSRVAQVRRLTSAARVLKAPDSADRRRVVAMRAAFALPYGDLLRYTRDPLGDLAAERYDALVKAALEEEGLRTPGYERGS